ncbi:MAG: hypothetical protein ACYSUX_07010 [Planctomycetota bacterium]|jgi:hypothetical protein
MNNAAKFGFIFTAWVLLCMAGCANIGPGNVNRDRFGYADALSDSWKRQMLLNLVKMRYGDAPVFLEVTSVVNQYALETELQGGLGWNTFLPEPSQSVGAKGRYANRPTITYQPLMGDKFTRSLMTPIRVGALLSLVQAGWRADMVYRLAAQSVNGIYNRAGGKLQTQPADPDFYRLTTSLLKIQQSLAVGMRIQETPDKKQATVMYFRAKDIDPDTEAEISSVKKLLGLDLRQQEFKIVYGSLPVDDQEIVILSRSMLEILLELGSYIEVPEPHVAQQRATPNVAQDADVAAGVEPLLRVQSDKKKPGDAYVAVEYRGYWFWIGDRDLKSKRMFSFLMFLFSLAETGTPEKAPVLTIPAG